MRKPKYNITLDNQVYTARLPCFSYNRKPQTVLINKRYCLVSDTIINTLSANLDTEGLPSIPLNEENILHRLNLFMLRGTLLFLEGEDYD